MKFLRVCHKTSIYHGMYRGPMVTFALDRLNFDREKHPMPWDDPGLDWDNFKDKGYLFAFPGVLELRKWIYDNNFFKILGDEGFYPHWIEAKGKHGWYQSVFNPDTVTSIQLWQWGEL